MENVAGSFRDPSGHLFFKDGILYRQVNNLYQENYDLLINSGLYEKLVESGLLIAHHEVNQEAGENGQAYKIIKPELIPFISYPYEWSFSQLKAAALCTLKIQKIALDFGMTLKDSSAYNIQFLNGRPLLIDTLSFEKYQEGEVWIGYKQFCQHFLAPLTLMSYKDVRLNQLLRVYIDGIPLDLTSSLLPSKTKYSFSLLSHIHLHSKSQKKHGDKKEKVREANISRHNFLGLIDNLESAIKKLKWQTSDTEWGDYYDKTNYSSDSFEVKKQLISDLIAQANPGKVWDLGANTGVFSRLASEKGIETVSFDIDPVAVEKNYLDLSKNGDSHILPLILDLTNPSPGIGWAHQERMSLQERGPVDTVLALALIHHLAISNNVPLEKVAQFFKTVCTFLIIEFVPKSDSQVQVLLTNREDIFPDYTKQGFEQSFKRHFEIQSATDIEGTERTLYLMKAS